MPVRELLKSRFGLKSASGMNKSKVCRCLFGMPDHEELRRDLDAQLKAINTDIKSTWSFDPVLDRPVKDGRFEWTLTDAPEFYTRPCRPSKFVNKRRELDTPVDNVESSDSDSDCGASSPVLVTPVTESTVKDADDERVEALEMKRENETTPEARVVRKSLITDFMRKRKRPAEDDSHDNVQRATKSLRL